jgi:hypothetical protein
MQESRRRSRLEQHLLSLVRAPRVPLCAAMMACLIANACGPAKAGSSEQALFTAADHSDSGQPVLPATGGADPGGSSRALEAGASDASLDQNRDELPRGTLVLHIGDSFAGSLGSPLGKRLKAQGLRYVLEYRDASYIPTWASAPELTGYISRHSPDLVVVTLGANEFELTAPETRANAVKRLIRRFEGRPCVWITPPRWKPDSGILNVIHENAKPCRYLDSDTIVSSLSRKKDGIHPNDEGREVWAEAVMTWLIRERRTGAERPWELRQE